MSPQPELSPATMPAPGARAASSINIRHPAGSIRVSAPTDVPLGELLPDLLDLAGLPDEHGWAIAPVDGDPYPPHATLEELGVGDDALLALRELPEPGSAGGVGATRQPTTVPRPLVSTPGPGERPLRDRSARLLPVRLSIPARCLTAAGAVARRDCVEDRCERESGVLGPAGFTRPARLSPVARMREAWADTDYRRRLEQAIAAPRLQRCVKIAVVSPKGGVFSRLLSVLPCAAGSH